MATLHGKEGRVIWTGKYTSHVHSWSADIDFDMVEDTAWEYDSTVLDATPVPGTGGAGWRTYIEGLRSFSGSFDCYMDDTTLPSVTPGAAAEIYLVSEYGNSYWHGMAIVTGRSIEASIEGIQEVTTEFQGVAELEFYPTPTP